VIDLSRTKRPAGESLHILFALVSSRILHTDIRDWRRQTSPYLHFISQSQRDSYSLLLCLLRGGITSDEPAKRSGPIISMSLTLLYLAAFLLNLLEKP
jgi:hypothetical protein